METREPLEHTAGDSLQFSRSLSDYPASAGWVLHYALRGPSAVDFAATPSGSDHLISLTSSTTAAWPAGDYAVQGYVVNGTDRRTVYTGRLRVLPDLAGSGAEFDTRSHARRTLDAIEAVIEGRASKDQQEYTIEGRRLVRIPVLELLQFRQRYRREVAAEERATARKNGRSTHRTVRVRFK